LAQSLKQVETATQQRLKVHLEEAQTLEAQVELLTEQQKRLQKELKHSDKMVKQRDETIHMLTKKLAKFEQEEEEGEGLVSPPKREERKPKENKDKDKEREKEREKDKVKEREREEDAEFKALRLARDEEERQKQLVRQQIEQLHVEAEQQHAATSKPSNKIKGDAFETGLSIEAFERGLMELSGERTLFVGIRERYRLDETISGYYIRADFFFCSRINDAIFGVPQPDDIVYFSKVLATDEGTRRFFSS